MLKLAQFPVEYPSRSWNAIPQNASEETSEEVLGNRGVVRHLPMQNLSSSNLDRTNLLVDLQYQTPNMELPRDCSVAQQAMFPGDQNHYISPYERTEVDEKCLLLNGILTPLTFASELSGLERQCNRYS